MSYQQIISLSNYPCYPCHPSESFKFCGFDIKKYQCKAGHKVRIKVCNQFEFSRPDILTRNKFLKKNLFETLKVSLTSWRLLQFADPGTSGLFNEVSVWALYLRQAELEPKYITYFYTNDDVSRKRITLGK